MLDYTLTYRTLSVKLTGEIDHANAPGFRIQLDNLIKTLKFDNFVIDLQNVTFMDSTAVGLIMGRYKKLKDLGKRVSFGNTSAAADKVLKVSGLYTIINKI